jgi:hypothetical protein
MLHLNVPTAFLTSVCISSLPSNIMKIFAVLSIMIHTIEGEVAPMCTHHTMNLHRGRECKAPRILDLGSVLSAFLPLDRRLDGPLLSAWMW